MAETKAYRVVQGRKMTIDGKPAKGGDTVQLTDAQAHAFRDAVVAQGAPEPPAAPPVGTRVNPVNTPTDNSKHEKEDASAQKSKGTAGEVKP